MCVVPGCRRKGIAGAIIEYVQDRARQDGAPFWLETGSPESRQLYKKHGFKDAGEIILGQGVVGRDGLPKDGGEGIKIWGMIWRPASKLMGSAPREKSLL